MHKRLSAQMVHKHRAHNMHRVHYTVYTLHEVHKGPRVIGCQVIAPPRATISSLVQRVLPITNTAVCAAYPYAQLRQPTPYVHVIRASLQIENRLRPFSS